MVDSSLFFSPNDTLWLAAASLSTYQGKSFEGALLVEGLGQILRSRSGTLRRNAASHVQKRV
jgi:hypothetical protein